MAKKTASAWEAGLLAIVCVGESESQRRDGETLSILAGQLAGSLPLMPVGSELAVAYEPLWTVGSGRVPEAAEVVEVVAYLRACLTARFGEVGASVRIVYGGSVEAANARGFLDMPGVGGVLIGGASLSTADFDAVLRVLA